MLSQSNIIRRALHLLSESSGRETALSGIILIARAFLPLMAVLLLGHYVDLLTGDGAAMVTAETGATLSALTWLTVVIALALLADDLLSFAGNYITKRHSYLLEGHISSLIHAHAGRLGLRFFEDPLFHDRIERAARDISWRPAALIADFIILLRGVISFAAMAYILRTFGLIPLVILTSVFIPVLLVRVRNSRRIYETRKRVTADARQASYFSWLLTGEKPAREVKLFDLGGYFDRLFRKHFRDSREPELQTVRRNIIPESLSSLLKVAAFAGVVIYATSKYLGGSITAGELAMYLVAFRQAMVYLRDAVTGYSGIAENRIFLQDLFLFLDLRPEMTGVSAAPEADSFRELSVEKLTFTYPGASGPALKDVSLRITRGEKVAIVGPNGSGKTTLVKLLCRLYDPDEGSITVNGTDAVAITPSSYRRLFSVVFQNFMLYYLSAGDNIRLGGSPGEPYGSEAGGKGPDSSVSGAVTGAVSGAVTGAVTGADSGTVTGAVSGAVTGADKGSFKGTDTGIVTGADKGGFKSTDTGTVTGTTLQSGNETVRKAAEATGLRELLESLPEGYDTQLGHHTEGGRELSWGEWQKIAISRAVYRKSPVLILDEPSSSLDADSEYEIFSDLGRITEGRTCIFISHRLSNVRDADRIIVLDGGRVAETGTHDELMAAGRRYHAMFTRQKSMYR